MSQTDASQPTKDDTSNFEFEAALSELEALVEQMEQGDMPLEASLKAFERGVSLSRQCQQSLTRAEQRVQILLDTQDGAQLADFTDTASAT